MNTSNITKYKPKDFARLLGVSVKTLLHIFSCRLYGLRKYKKQIKEDGEIAKELQDRNKTNTGTECKNQ